MTHNHTKKKLAFVITKGNFGGAQKYVYDLARSLSPDQYMITVITGNEGALTEKLQNKGLKFKIIPALKRDVGIISDIHSLFTLIQILREIRPHILHLNSSKVGIFGAIIGRILRIPQIIFTAHGWAHVEERPIYQKPIIKFLHILTVLLVHKTIAVSNQIRSQMPKILSRKKIVVIHNGIESINYKSREDAYRILQEKTKFSDTEMLIGVISELHKNKGLSYLISAMRHFPKATLVIIGCGEERKNLIKQITDLNLTKNVFLAGHIDNASELLLAFDIFVLPSVKEGFPYVLLEAANAKLPIVATNVGGVPEIIIDKKTGLLIPPKNTGTLVEAILLLISNDAQRISLGSKAQDYVQSTFTLEKMVARTKNLYINSS